MSFIILKKESLSFFRGKYYKEALQSFEYMIEKIENKDPEIKDLLDETEQTIPLDYDIEKRNIYSNIMTCIHHILVMNQFDGYDEIITNLNKFNNYLDKYFLLAKQEKPEDLRKWADNILINVFEYSIELAILQYAADMQDVKNQKDKLQCRVRALYHGFIYTFCQCGAFDEMQFIVKFHDILYFERSNVNRNGHSGQNYLNALWLAELFLAPGMVEKKANTSRVRAAVMNLLSELVLYSPSQTTSRRRYNREHDALAWLDRCLEEDPNNIYANERKNQLASYITSAEQINRFKHDAVSKIEAIRGTINQVISLTDSSQEIKELQTATDNINFITNTFRLTSKENARIRYIDINTILNSFSDVDLIKQINGTKQSVESDSGYLLLILDNLIKNSKEAYGDNASKPIFLSFNYDTKTFSVKDYAGGIPEELQCQDKLFEPYVSTKGIFQNAGIGLASANEACKLIDAELSFHIIEENGFKGTEFLVKLREHEED